MKKAIFLSKLGLLKRFLLSFIFFKKDKKNAEKQYTPFAYPDEEFVFNPNE